MGSEGLHKNVSCLDRKKNNNNLKKKTKTKPQNQKADPDFIEETVVKYWTQIHFCTIDKNH